MAARPDRAAGRADARVGRGRAGAAEGRDVQARPSAAAAARSRCCGGRAPTLLNPHFATGTKDQDGSRIFYEPLASCDPDGNLVPGPGRRDPERAERRRHQGRPVGHLEAQEGRHLARRQAVHRRRRASSTGSSRRIPATAARTIGSYEDVEKIDVARQPHGAARLQEADAVLGRPLLRRARHDHPQAPVRGLQGRQVPRGAEQPQAGRHRAPTSSWTSSRATSCAARSTRATTCRTGRSSTPSR